MKAQMTDHWGTSIGLLIHIKTQILHADPDDIYGSEPPHLGASDADLDLAELRLSEKIDPQHRQLLQHADGWPRFFISNYLLTSQQLSDPLVIAQTRKSNELAIEHLDIDLDDWGLIAKDFEGRSTMLIGRTSRPFAGQVLWLDGEEIDRFPTVRDWFESMIAYHREGLEEALSLQ
ncbi:MAG: hypothetical protein PGN11_10720 [Quadrisphaera sp.]